MHIVSDACLKRPGYEYIQLSSGSWVGVPDNSRAMINWSHIDGPLLYRSDGQLHWLTLWERLGCWLGYHDAYSLDRKLQPPSSTNGGRE